MGSLIEVVLGLGSNVGDSRYILSKAEEELKEHLKDCVFSRIYQSEPMYVIDQPPYYNSACRGIWNGTPQALLELCNRIEARYGRDRNSEIRRGARTLDIDILLFGELCIETETLSIPHPLLHERQFALVPLLELCPLAKDPRDGVLWSKKLAQLPPQGVYSTDIITYNDRSPGRA